MNRIILSNPPSPTAYSSDNASAYLADLYQWLLQLKGTLENNSQVNARAAGSAIVVGSYTASNTVTGTMTGTDLANFVATFANALIQKGIIASNVSRSDTT